MATPTIKATYTVDVETKRTLDRLAAKWDVSKSEALRRAIRQAAGTAAATNRLAALDALQSRIPPSVAARWSKRQRAERQAAAVRAEGGGR